VYAQQQLAFPTAKGAGAFSVGGRGGTVVHVTNLNDNGPGSFRDALGDNRTIVFDISGVINLSSSIDVTINNVTIAGQTAPGQGISFTGNTVVLKGDNIIIRYLRFRGSSNNGDAFNLYYSTNTIVDHCSFSFGQDEAFSVGTDTSIDTYNVTVQNCFFAESTSGGGIVGDGSNNFMDRADQMSYIGNTFYNISHRFPNVAMDGRVDIINNVVWNMEKRLVRGNGSYHLNQLNNYYDYGTPIHDKILNHHSYSPGSFPIIYSNGNKIESVFGVRTGMNNGEPYTLTSTIEEMNDDNFLSWKWFLEVLNTPYGNIDRGVQLTTDFKSNNQFPILGQNFDILSADESKINIPNNSGACKSLNSNGGFVVNRDEFEIEWLNNINQDIRTASLNEPYPTPELNSIIRPLGYDTDSDGMADEWELINYNTLVNDGTIDIDGNGYTELEDFLNQVDSSPVGNVEATEVNITPDVATLNVSENLQLNTQFTPVNTTDQTGVWTSENDGIASVDANGLVTGNSEGSVEIRFVSNDGGFTATSQITVIPLPLIADAGDDQTICEGQEIQLTAEEAPSYLWSTGETTQSINVSPIITTTYILTVTDGNSTEIDEVTVFVDSMPDLTVSEDVSIVEGDIIELSVTGANTYLWSTGETTSSITVSPLETTTYNVTGTNGVCEVSENITVTVEPLLNVDLGEDQQICEGSGESIILDAGNGDSYLWNTGETTQTISVDPVSTSTYSVTVTSGTQEDTDSITIFVDPNPNVVILNGDSVDILNGDFVTLSATGANTYEWNNGATQPNIAVSPAQTTVYEVRGYINECYDEKQVVVNVIPEVEADAGDDVEICLGETVLLTATGGDEYVWSNGEITPSIEVSPTETTEYTVTVFNALDFGEDSVVVNVISDCEESIEEPDPTINSDEPFEFTFDVFPNPTSNYVDVRIAGIENLARIYIYDMMGKLIYQKRIQNGSANVSSISRFDMSKLIPGIYYIQFQNLEKTMAKKLLVQ